MPSRKPTPVTPVCIGCNKSPSELDEYVEATDGYEHVTPECYVIENEGTYNMFEQDKFYCTTCYINAGMPNKGDE